MHVYGVPTLKNHDWLGMKVISKEKGVGEGFGHRSIEGAWVGLRKKAKFGVVMG